MRTEVENCLGRYSRRLRNQNVEHFIDPSYESNILETQIIFPIWKKIVCELTRTSESKNHIKIKTTHHRVMENGCIWEGIPLMNGYWVS